MEYLNLIVENERTLHALRYQSYILEQHKKYLTNCINWLKNQPNICDYLRTELHNLLAELKMVNIVLMNNSSVRIKMLKEIDEKFFKLLY